MNKSQLAMCAAKMAGLKNGRPKTVQNCTVSEEDKLAAEEAGKVFGVSRRQVFHALRVLREGCSKLIEQCETALVSAAASMDAGHRGRCLVGGQFGAPRSDLTEIALHSSHKPAETPNAIRNCRFFWARNGVIGDAGMSE